MKLQNLQLFVTIPAALYLGKEITNNKIYGTFFLIELKNFMLDNIGIKQDYT